MSTQRSLLKSKEYQLCVDLSTVALSSHQDLRICCNRGIAYAKLGDYVRAIQDFTTILNRVNERICDSFNALLPSYRMRQI